MAIISIKIKEEHRWFGSVFGGSKVYIETELADELDEIYEWCYNQFGPYGEKERWLSWSTNVRAEINIKNQDDLTLFKLRWL